MSGAAQMCQDCGSPLSPCRCERDRAREDERRTTRHNRGPKAGRKKPQAAWRRREKAKRDRERYELHYHSPEFVEWVHAQQCVRCGRRPSEPHHEPPKGRGGTYKDVSPVCGDCHTAGVGARHKVGPVTFWAAVGITAEESNRRTQAAWQRRQADTPLRGGVKAI